MSHVSLLCTRQIFLHWIKTSKSQIQFHASTVPYPYILWEVFVTCWFTLCFRQSLLSTWLTAFQTPQYMSLVNWTGTVRQTGPWIYTWQAFLCNLQSNIRFQGAISLLYNSWTSKCTYVCSLCIHGVWCLYICIMTKAKALSVVKKHTPQRENEGRRVSPYVCLYQYFWVLNIHIYTNRRAKCIPVIFYCRFW